MDLYGALTKIDMQRAFRGFTLSLAFVALGMNMSASWKVFGQVPLREAASRSLMAVDSSFFFDSGLSEPVPVAALKAGMLTGTDPDRVVRIEGLAVFAAVFLLTLFTLKRRFGETASAMAALFLAGNPYMGYYAMQGDSHLYSLFFLLLFWHYFDSPEGGRLGDALAGLFGGLACLSRLDSAWVILAVAGLAWAVKRGELDLKRAGLSLGLALALTLPYLGWQKAAYGRFLHSQEISLRRWDNVDRFGYAPGARREQGPLPVPSFIFRNGPLGPLADSFRGLGRGLSYELPRTLYYKWLLVLVFLGVYAAFVRKKDGLLFLAAAVLLPVLPLAAIKEVPSSGGIEFSYYLQPLWALCALAGLGLQETMEWVEEAAGKWAASLPARGKGGGRKK
ncbi:MAG: glycosyltransferase family 39 protein [Elusimicrobia bacterium]|nr:glycosyltransferase family 39 protein [Elusimicrobiota bacterium]